MAGALPSLKSSTYMAGTLPKIDSLSINIICRILENINSFLTNSTYHRAKKWPPKSKLSEDHDFCFVALFFAFAQINVWRTAERDEHL